MDSSQTVDSILDSIIDGGTSGNFTKESFGEEKNSAFPPSTQRIKFYEPGYKGRIDPRIRNLSYSSLLTLHSCPRKYQLYKLRTTFRSEEETKQSVTFAFGHVVGEGVQLALQGVSEKEIIWKLFLGWHTNLFAEEEKAKKSFWAAVFAVQKFILLQKQGVLDEYELVSYQGKPACELSFTIAFPDGFKLRGFVDAVLRNKVTGKIFILEVKTTGNKILNPATYKNSAQAIGYSIVLDVLFPELSSYEVLYLVYQTLQYEFTPLLFPKTYLQRAQWIRELLLDIESIQRYEEAGIYPMHGESCYNFYRECEYFQTCTLSTEYLTKECTPDDLDKTEYQINITLENLLDAQLGKIGEF